MKTLQWQKIPITSVIGKSNLWTMVGRLHNNYEMDYTKMDALFSVDDVGPKRPGQVPDVGPDGKKKKENLEINILDGKRSLNVNIFLKQFRMSHEEIVQFVRDGRGEMFGAERLRSLLKLLPSQDEIDAIKAFDGDRERLGNAEKFFICLMGLPNFRMRIEGLLIMQEFNVNMEWIRPSIEAVIQAARDIMDSKSLKELIFLILMSGNYLNSGNYAGNAAGFKLSSLLKLTELRANKPRMNLMHYVAQEAREKNPKLLNFPDEMKFVKDASQVSVETLTTDISNIANKVRAITEQIGRAGVDFQQQMKEFLKEANVEVVELEEDLKEIEMMKQELSTFFAEDPKQFKLEECFRVFQTFCDRFKKAMEENIQRQLQESKAEERRKAKDMGSKKRSSVNLPDSPEESSESPDTSNDFSTSQEDEDGSIVDILLADVRSGFTSRKFNDGNFSVKKVTKVNLLDAITTGTGSALDASEQSEDSASFVRNGYGRVSHRKKHLSSSSTGSPSPTEAPSPTPDFSNQRRNRRSYATEDNESLIDFLMDAENPSPSEPLKPETAFERYGSLRRRRQERKEKKNVLDVFTSGRERSASPSIPESPTSASGIKGGDVQQRATASPLVTSDRPKSQHSMDYPASPSGRALRRTRSWLDRPSIDTANREVKAEAADESDALLDRIKQRLGKKTDGRSRTDEHSRLEKTDSSDSNSSYDDEPSSRNSSRWRSGISVPESPLETITEKSPDVAFAKASKSDSLEGGELSRHSRERLSNRFNNGLDPKEMKRAVSNVEDSSKPKYSSDDSDMHSPSVAVSVRKQISSGMGTNIDHILKTIEDTGRTIDTVGVSGPIKRAPETPEVKAASIQPEPQVAVVAHLSSSNRPITPINEVDLKAKRDKRKKRSTLSMEDVRAAMKLDGPAAPSDISENKTLENTNATMVQDFNQKNNLQSGVISQDHQGRPVAKTPPSPRKPSTNNDTNTETKKTNGTNNKELSKAAKLAAKKRFKDARFGESNSSESKGRTKSNVETDSVNQALKEMANQGSMSRSKSYDEHVAKNGDVEFNSNMMRAGNGGSAPGTSGEKKAVLRNSTSRLSMDGRRNGLYIPSDESDTELTPEDLGSRRTSSAKSDSPKSMSRLSLKSTNTSTETLQADAELSPEQRRRSGDSISSCRSSNTLSANSDFTDSCSSRSLHQEVDMPRNMSRSEIGSTNTGTLSPIPPRPQSATAIELEHSYLRRTYSLMERTRLHTEDDDDNDNPLAKMAKWRMNRNRERQRRSVYDNVQENEPLNNVNNSSNRSYLSPTSALTSDSFQPTKTEVSDLKNEVGSRSSYASSYASSNERDEGFETGSGSGSTSQRTSMSSTIESEIYATPIVSRKLDGAKPKAQVEPSPSDKVPSGDSVITRLSIEAERKERTETWTEQTVRANGINNDQNSDTSQEFSALSPDSGHSTSREDIWSEEQMEVTSEPTATKKEPTPSKTATRGTKAKSVPSYMKPTSSSSSRPAQSKTSSSTDTQISKAGVVQKRDTPNRIAIKEKEQPATLKRDISARASMRAETASAGFHRGAASRTSVRGPRSSVKLTAGSIKTVPDSTGSPGMISRSRADSSTSISSIASSSSNINASTSSLTKKRLSSSSGSTTKRPTTPSANRPTTPSANRPTTPSANRPTTPLNRPTTPSIKVSPAQPSNKNGSNFSRTQSMRVTSRSSVGSEADSSVKTGMRKSTPVSSGSSSNLSRSTTPQPQDKSRSTTPQPERPHSTTPFSREERASTRRSSFMSPTASSKAKKDPAESPSPVAPVRTKSLGQNSSPLTRHSSLRLPKKSISPANVISTKDLMAGRKSPSSLDSPLMHKQDHHQSLSTVTELVADEDKEAKGMESSKKSPSLLRRIGIVKGKPSQTSTAAKTSKSTVSAASGKKK